MMTNAEILHQLTDSFLDRKQLQKTGVTFTQHAHKHAVYFVDLKAVSTDKCRENDRLLRTRRCGRSQ